MAGNVVYKGKAGQVVNAVRVGSTQATFNSSGIAEVDPTDTNLVSGLSQADAVRVDKAGTAETLTPGTVQTATTLSAIRMLGGAGATVLNIRDTDGTGTLLVGPITVSAAETRIIVFPTALSAPGGVFIDIDSGGLNASPGQLVP